MQKKNAKGDLLYNIQLLDPDNPQTVLLTSVDVKDGCCLSELMNDMMEHADDQQYYIFQQDLKKERPEKPSGTIGAFPGWSCTTTPIPIQRCYWLRVAQFRQQRQSAAGFPAYPGCDAPYQ